MVFVFFGLPFALYTGWYQVFNPDSPGLDPDLYPIRIENTNSDLGASISKVNLVFRAKNYHIFQYHFVLVFKDNDGPASCVPSRSVFVSSFVWGSGPAFYQNAGPIRLHSINVRILYLIWLLTVITLSYSTYHVKYLLVIFSCDILKYACSTFWMKMLKNLNIPTVDKICALFFTLWHCYLELC